MTEIGPADGYSLFATLEQDQRAEEQLTPIEHWAYHVETPFRPVHELLEMAPAALAPQVAMHEEIAWNGSADQLAFREAVLQAHLDRSRSRKGPPGRDLSGAELSPVAGTRVRMRRDAAEAAGRLIAAANEALTAAKQAGDPDALKTRRVTAASGYRGSEHQTHLWRRYFPDYYRRTARHRDALGSGTHGPEAVSYMIKGFGLPKWIAAPGYSNHQSGIAIDLQQERVRGAPIGNSSRPAARTAWRGTWLYGWLVQNAASFGFRPYEREPWHWEYRPAAPVQETIPAEEYEPVQEPEALGLDEDEHEVETGKESAFGLSDVEEAGRLEALDEHRAGDTFLDIPETGGTALSDLGGLGKAEPLFEGAEGLFDRARDVYRTVEPQCRGKTRRYERRGERESAMTGPVPVDGHRPFGILDLDRTAEGTLSPGANVDTPADPTGEAWADELINPLTCGDAPSDTEADATSVATPTLRRGSRGSPVSQLQRALVAAGHPVAVDGDYGPTTEAAIRAFQGRAGLAVDGVAGPATWSRLVSDGPAAGTAPSTPAAGKDSAPDIALGTLVLDDLGRSWTYTFTPADLAWTAKLLVYEAGGDDNADNAAVLWAMFNRYALFTHRVFGTFSDFVRAYSTTLQPVLRSARAAARHAHKPPSEFVRTGGTYPGTNIPRGQLRRHLVIQQAPWRSVKASARELAARALGGRLPNPGIGLASEFASTRIYFRQQHGRDPGTDEWRRYTMDLASRKKWRWVGDVPGLNQMKNAFFLDLRAADLPSGAVRVLQPGQSGEVSPTSACEHEDGVDEGTHGEWELDEREDDEVVQESASQATAQPSVLIHRDETGEEAAFAGENELEPQPTGSAKSPARWPERSDEDTREAAQGGAALEVTGAAWLRAMTAAGVDSGTAPAGRRHAEANGWTVGDVGTTMTRVFTGVTDVLARANALAFDNFVHRIDGLERLATADGYTLTQRVTAFRKVFYDSVGVGSSYPGVPTGTGAWNILIPGAAATPLPPSWRTPAGAEQVKDLRARKDQVIGGVRVDISHVLTGLDARNHRTDVNLSVLGFPLVRMRSNLEATTFTGDLGSVVVEYLLGSKRSFRDTAMELEPTLLDEKYNALAQSDMAANADAHVVALDPSHTLADNLRAYYTAVTGGWHRRWQRFVVAIGLGTFTSVPAAFGPDWQSRIIGTFSGSTERWRADMQGEVMSAALAYAAAQGHRTDVIAALKDPGPGTFSPTFWEMYWNASGWVLEEFLRRLKVAVKAEVGDQTFP
jgi:Putative peptidoglycan binding domain/D-alanyl-D-alanine carboxypeptidase